MTLLQGREGLSSIASLAKVEDLVAGSLLEPLESFLRTPGKNLRAKLVETSFRLARPRGETEGNAALRAACLIIEALHAGALIIDDIEDGSPTRRNAPALHVRHGVPVALNAGCWLYFWALHQIGTMGLEASIERSLQRACHAILMQAHFGQAIDVGVKIDEVPRERVLDTCLASIDLKTGALAGLAMRLGGVAGGGSPARLELLESTGRRYGVVLQLHEDLGNFLSQEGSSYCLEKKLEDFRLRRPTWVWAVAAERFPDDYAAFVAAVQRLPDERELAEWVLGRDFAAAARAEARRHLERARALVIGDFGASHPEACEELLGLIDCLEKSYG